MIKRIYALQIYLAPLSFNSSCIQVFLSIVFFGAFVGMAKIIIRLKTFFTSCCTIKNLYQIHENNYSFVRIHNRH